MNNDLFFLIFGLNNKNPFLDQLMIFSTDYLIYIAFFIIFALGVKGSIKEKKSLLVILIAFPILILMIKGIHLFIVQPRPFVEYEILPLISPLEDASFPSRHASIIFTIAFSYLFYKSKWSSFFLALAITVGISRVYVGVHYPLDILGGIAFGFLAVLLSWRIKKFLYPRIFN